MKNKKRGIGKKGIFESASAIVILVAVVLVVLLLSYLIWKSKGIGAIEYIKNIFRSMFGG